MLGLSDNRQTSFSGYLFSFTFESNTRREREDQQDTIVCVEIWILSHSCGTKSPDSQSTAAHCIANREWESKTRLGECSNTLPLSSSASSFFPPFLPCQPGARDLMFSASGYTQGEGEYINIQDTFLLHYMYVYPSNMLSKGFLNLNSYCACFTPCTL